MSKESSKKNFLVDKNKMPLAVGIAFVAFTTQFGGGFASGAQIFQYFINYGIWCLLLPLISQGLYALFFWYGMRYAYAHEAYDYRSFSNKLYGKTSPVMSNLFELCYLIMIGTASAAAFATGGSTLNTLTPIPYWLCTLLIAAFIFIIVLFGTDVLRKVASTLSVLIIVGLVVILVPNIIAQWGDIMNAISGMAAGNLPVRSSADGSFGSALWLALLYFFFQLPSVSVMYQHMEPIENKKQINSAAIWIFIVNTVSMMLTIFGLLAIIYVADSKTASIPMLVLVQNGVASAVLTPIISILIILGSVSTGVNMIAGIVSRCTNAVEKSQEKNNKAQWNHMTITAIFALLFIFITFAISQFGLMAIIVKGYAYLGYAGIITVFIPFIIHAIKTKLKDI